MQVRVNRNKVFGPQKKKRIYPDESQVTAIKNMPSPENTKDLERFLGLINYVGRFIPNLSEKSNSLRLLLKKEVEWHWTPEYLHAFSKLKQHLTNKPVLQYFDASKPVVISVHASKSGLGVCLLQSNLPVPVVMRHDLSLKQNIIMLKLKRSCWPVCFKPGLSCLPIHSRYIVASGGSGAHQSVDLRDHFDAKAQVCAVTACNLLMDTHFVQLQKCTYLYSELQ